MKPLAVIRKFFPLDKNYLLEEAQVSQQHELLMSLLKKVKALYELQNNPLAIEDCFTKKIRAYVPENFTSLTGFYLALAGVYRFKFGDNQLEMIWDGESHFEKYKREWAVRFDQWTSRFCQHEQFVQAVLDLTVFESQARDAQMAENRMNFVMMDFFELKIHKSKGIVAMKIA